MSHLDGWLGDEEIIQNLPSMFHSNIVDIRAIFNLLTAILVKIMSNLIVLSHFTSRPPMLICRCFDLST